MKTLTEPYKCSFAPHVLYQWLSIHTADYPERREEDDKSFNFLSDREI
jgi:hypothetical protein